MVTRQYVQKPSLLESVCVKVLVSLSCPREGRGTGTEVYGFSLLIGVISFPSFVIMVYVVFFFFAFVLR